MYRPKQGSDFYMVNSRGEVRKANHNGSQKMAARIAYGNSFKTASEAEEYRNRIAQMGKYGLATQQRVGVVAKILTWLVYLLLIAIVIACICLVIDFIFWIFDINVTVWGVKL